jgi:predicted acetyltransferase
MGCGGTTIAAVQPTHRRQGILRRLIDAHLDDVRAREEPIAGLFASDSAIYGRFGYGMASVSAYLTVSRPHVGFHRRAPNPTQVRTVPAAEAVDHMQPVFDRVVATRPGMFSRSGAWWARRVHDEADDRHGATAYRYAVAGAAGAVSGYAQYRLKPGTWDDGHGNGRVLVREIVAATPEAAAGLWGFLLNHDLVESIEVDMIPVDDPLFALMAGYRRASPTISDQLFIRIVDLYRALEGRRYSCDGAVSFRLHDPMTGGVASYRLGVSEGVGTVTPADDGDIELDVEDLGTAFLGRSRFRALARAGRLSGMPAALALADTMFAWDPAPWCQEIF